MSVKLKPLSEQVIVITGASSGIGRTTARRAAERGATVLLVARDEDGLREVVGEIEAAGGTAAYAGMVGKYAIEQWARVPVDVELAHVVLECLVLPNALDDLLAESLDLDLLLEVRLRVVVSVTSGGTWL